MNKVIEQTQVYRVWGIPTIQLNYPPPYSNALATGAGVIAAVIDTGIDYKHLDFKPESGGNRVKFIWDQTIIGTPPIGFTYGAEWNNTQIVAETVTSNDTDGRGTLMAGIIAGSGRATGNGQLPYRYVGMAPEADIIIVKISTLAQSYRQILESKMRDAVQYVMGKADELGKPCVVFIPNGQYKGGHDGTSSLDYLLEPFTGPGKIIVASPGNDGAFAIHSSVTIGAVGGTDSVTFDIPTYTPTPTINEEVDIEGWHNLDAGFKVKLTSPNGFTTGFILPGASSGNISSTDGSFRVDNALTGDTTLKGKKVFLRLFDAGDNVSPKAGTWTIALERASGTTTGQIDFFVIDQALGNTQGRVQFLTHISDTTEVASPATGDTVLCAAPYITRNQFINADNQLTIYPGILTVGDICQFSNPGPRRDLVYRPNVAAPGFIVFSTRSAQYAVNATYLDLDGVHTVTRQNKAEAGSAVLAGMATLFLQHNRDAEPGDIAAWQHGNATSDSFTGSVPNGDWGYGKAKAFPLSSLTEPLAMSHALVLPTSSQKFRFTALAGAQFKTSTITSTTVTGTNHDTQEALQLVIGNITATSFDVNSQEHGPIADLTISVSGVLDVNDRPFLADGVHYVLSGTDTVSGWV